MLHTIFPSSENQKGECFSENLEWVSKWDPTSDQTTSNHSQPSVAVKKQDLVLVTRMRSTEPLITVVFSWGTLSSLKENKLCDRTGKPKFMTGTLWRAPEQTPEVVATGSCSHLRNRQGGRCHSERNLSPELKPPRQSIQLCISLWSHSHPPPARDALPVSSVLQVWARMWEGWIGRGCVFGQWFSDLVMHEYHLST